MCTVITNKAKPRIATEDIKVYKFCKKGSNRIVSAVYEYPYVPNVLNKAEFVYSSIGSCSDVIEDEYSISLRGVPRFVRDGFHSYNSIERAMSIKWYGKILCLFIIPKGSFYYMNKCGNVVSNQIIFKECLKG